MAVQPPPRHYRCLVCHWSMTVAPTSDVLMPGFDHFSACPQCGHAPLDTQTATGLAGGIVQLVSTLEKAFRR